MQVTIRDATEDDLPAMLEIYNDAVLNTTAVWTIHTADLENRRALMRERKAKGYPVLVATLGDMLLGYASFGDFRPWDGYGHTVEHSIYVHQHHHGKGVGKAMMPPLIAAARALGKHVMVAGVDAANTSSLQFHQRFGFVEAGRMREVGWKFDRWLDLVLLQKMLD
ncbi:phosphinothricin acetyltransferase [Alsobacter metallidurans]|uniref:Phosphinothricin acetyltransferase n=1 Tax=Alsobacter metallidurans TaxID=340221 RepID=A0A917IAZ8_9HYPH|nr:GNAT family N-acetyltransferase [Alsobacter metallidurans]GGH33947.1 phosphinothricin acetyltransferase [Alsobacter metallidurans]